MNGIENNKKGDPEYNLEDHLPVFINEGTARVLSPRSVSGGVQKQIPNRESKLPEILDIIKDPNFSVSEITRLITVEMTLIAQDMRTYESDRAAGFKLKNCTGQIKALRAVAEAAKEADAWAKREDLDFDGPKFNFVYGEFIKDVKKAAQAVLKDDQTTVQSIMKHLRDILAVHEPELRRKTEKIGPQKAL
jgi:hypothetical protein